LKPELIEMLRDKISQNPELVALAVTALVAAAAAVATDAANTTAPPALTKPVADAGNPSSDWSGPDQQQPATTHLAGL
jgi:hypothetical protein